MGTDLHFLLFGGSTAQAEGAFARKVFELVTAFGLEYGGGHRDPTAPDGRWVYPGDSPAEQRRGFDRALSLAEASGEGEVRYRMILANEEKYDLSVDVSWERTEGETRWRVRLTCPFNQLCHGENLTHFLDDVILPLCLEIRPSYGWGDNLYWYDDPTPDEIRRGAPMRLAWFTLLGRPTVDRLGRERIDALATARTVALPDGGAIILSTESPSGFEDEVEVRERLSRELGLRDLLADSKGTWSHSD